MSLRARLATLDDAALETISNRGLLRRAGKDVEAGLVGELTDTADGGIQAVVDGASVRVPPSGLAKASCTCRAPGACRHRLAVALACRGLMAGPSPAMEREAAPLSPEQDTGGGEVAAELCQWDEARLIQAVGRGVVRAALAQFEDGEPVEIAAEPGGLRIRWPDGAMVRFRAGGGLGGMISRVTGQRREILHVATILACRRHLGLDEPSSGLTPRTQPEEDPGDAVFLDEIEAILGDLMRCGLAQATVAAAERVAELAVCARGDDFPRLARQLRGLSAELRGLAERQIGCTAAGALGRVATLGALVHALRWSPRRASGSRRMALKGRHRETYRDVGTLDLVPVAAHRWSTAAGAEGIRAHYWSPAEDRWYSVSRLRLDAAEVSWPGPAFTSLGPWPGTRFRDDAGQRRLRLLDAKASDEGRLSLSARTQAHPLSGPWMAEGERFGANDFDRWSELRRWAAGRIPLGLTDDWTDAVVVIRPRTILPAVFNPGSHSLTLPVLDGDGATLPLRVVHRSGTEPRLSGWRRQSFEPPPVVIVCLAPAFSERGLDLEPITALWSRPAGGFSVVHMDFSETPDAPAPDAGAAIGHSPADTLLPPRWLGEMVDLIITVAERGTVLPLTDWLRRDLARLAATAHAVGLDRVAAGLSRLQSTLDPPGLMQTAYDLFLLKRACVKAGMER